MPLPLRIAALLCATWGVLLLRPGPKLAIAVFPAALFLAGAFGLYRGRRDGALAALLVTIPWLLLAAADFTPRHLIANVLGLGSLAYIVVTILFYWRALRRSSEAAA